ncbi:hypothetical protein OIU77_010056 [Salix suchowensis]|uniref:Uncharacterized protein n=1 Tax=Salix suchowensis TaxID=1278906 RepID=A0ABQ9A6Z3_9ROSI|nr:hypothetical protein OIU77_010056 [Salix suchowensis]
MELITGARHRVLIRPRAEPRKNATPVAGTTGCSMFWPLGGLGVDLRESLCPSHEVERAHTFMIAARSWNDWMFYVSAVRRPGLKRVIVSIT